MWISINSGPGELGYMFKDKITFINGMRTIFAIIFSILMIMLAISLIIKDHKQLAKIIKKALVDYKNSMAMIKYSKRKINRFLYEDVCPKYLAYLNKISKY